MVGKKKRVGKYLIHLNEKLGQGAFAIVYRGIEQATEQPVAVKVADKLIIEEDEYTKSAFYSEIQIMKHLKSKNIIRFLDVHETKNNYYIVQELAEGGTLRKLMKQQKKFSQEEAMGYFIQLLNGFGELVKNGIIHRDVKPENILIHENLLKIADFGFAKQSDNNSFMKSIIGTPLYMSPQILLCQQYSYKCDIWALGVILYEMLLGHPPWTLKYKNMLENIRQGKVVFPSSADIAPKLQQLIIGCLAYKEEDRFEWEQIYMHQLFADKFKQNFTGEKGDSIKLAFIISGLRMTIHSQNIDMGRLIQKLPKQLNDQDFESLIKLIDPSLMTAQIKLLYQSAQKKAKTQGAIKRDDLGEYLSGIGVRMNSLNLSEIHKDSIQEEEGEQVGSAFLLVAHLKQRLDETETDIYELYRMEDKSRTNALGLKQFSTLVTKIDDALRPDQISALFTEFDLNKDGKVSFNQFYRTICKIAGVAQVKDEKESAIFKKK